MILTEDHGDGDDNDGQVPISIKRKMLLKINRGAVEFIRILDFRRKRICYTVGKKIYNPNIQLLVVL